jgi:uncharacterized membrane protein
MRPSSQNRWSRFAGPAFILLAALAAVAPQLILGNSCGHDFDFHLVSWFDALNSWRHGIPYPHWAPSANFGAGEPRFVFYPPLTWMLGAALGAALPWQLVPVALTFLLLVGTGLATRALARLAISEGAATLAGCAALFCGYSLFTAYERSAFGELAGGFWLPLVLLFLLPDRHPSAPALRRALDGSAAPLALVLAGAWLSNVPVGIMACYLAAGLALALALLQKSWAPLVRAGLAAALGIGLAALYLLPAIREQRWVDVEQATGDPGMLIENSWLFARHADPQLGSHDIELRKVSILAVSMLAVALVGLLIAWLRGRSARNLQSNEQRLQTRRFWILLALIPPVVLFLLLPVSLPVWNLLPKLRFLQFPWRWLTVLEAPMAIFFAAAVWPASSARRWKRAAVVFACAAVFLAASFFAGIRFLQPCDQEDAVAPMVGVYRTGAGFEGYDEFEPPDSDSSLVATGLPDACLVSDPAVQLGVVDVQGANPDWWVEQGSCDRALTGQFWPPETKRLRAVLPHAGFLILRLRAYPAWRIMLNGRQLENLPQRADGLMAVPVQQGPVDLAITWTTTPDLLAGRWLSVLFVLLLTLLSSLERMWTRPGLS